MIRTGSERIALGAIAALLALAAVPAGAQRVLLELRPRVGDTLHMRLDQQTVITGARTDAGAPPLRVTTSVTLFSRAIVLSSDLSATVVLAVTDSVSVRSDDEHARALVEQARRGLEGRRVRLRLVPDGTLGAAGPDPAMARDVKDLVSVMPGALPRVPVAVGDTWSRAMPLPGSSQLELPAGGRVTARFRLDSLSGAGELAWISMRGSFEAPGEAQREDAAAGSVTGTLVVNRRRGWLEESRFLIQMRSTLPASARANRAGMQFRTRITQQMKVLEERRP